MRFLTALSKGRFINRKSKHVYNGYINKLTLLRFPHFTINTRIKILFTSST